MEVLSGITVVSAAERYGLAWQTGWCQLALKTLSMISAPVVMTGRSSRR